MLSDIEKHEIEQILTHYEFPHAAGLESLKIVQRHRRWVTDEALADISDFLSVPQADLEAVATFYNLVFRRPVGRHVILACDSISCWLLGCDRLCAAFRDYLGIRFGETTEDRRFTLLPSVCLGNCDHAPALMIDDDHHGPVEASGLARLLERYE